MRRDYDAFVFGAAGVVAACSGRCSDEASRVAASLSLCLLSFNLAHAKPKKPDVPAVFQNARYIYVEAMDGDIFSPRLFPEDRQAIADVEDSLRAWKRYALALNREDADLVILVRKGRLAAVKVGGGVSVGRGPYSTAGRTEVGARTEVGTPDDALQVYIQHEGELTGIVWERTMDRGLNAPDVQLMKQLRAAVDRAYPLTTTSGKKP